MAILQRELNNEDIRIVDNGDIRILSESNIHDDIIEFTLAVKQVFTFSGNIQSSVLFDSTIKQLVDLSYGL